MISRAKIKPIKEEKVKGFWAITASFFEFQKKKNMNHFKQLV